MFPSPNQEADLQTYKIPLIKMWFNTHVKIIQYRVMENLQPLPASQENQGTRQETPCMGWQTLTAHTHTLTHHFYSAEGNLVTHRKATQTSEEHANSTQGWRIYKQEKLIL